MKQLTKRQQEIVNLIVTAGLSNKDIGHKLGITEGTVKVILSKAFRRLGVHSRTMLIHFYYGDKNVSMG